MTGKAGGCRGARILIEPGRGVVAPNAVTVYRVTTVKPGATTFVAVDGGWATTWRWRWSLVGQRFEAAIAGRPGGGELVSVVGRHCEAGDVLSEGAWLRDPRIGPRIHYLRACKPRIHRAVTLGNRVSIGLRRAATGCDGPRWRLEPGGMAQCLIDSPR